MEYNKRRFTKLNDQKVLHKVKKQWVVLSLSLLALLGGGATVALTPIHADANGGQPAQNHVTDVLKNRINAQLKSSQTSQQHPDSASASNRQQISTRNIVDQASYLHNRILQNADLSRTSAVHQQQSSQVVPASHPTVGTTESNDVDGMNYTYDPSTKSLTFTSGVAGKTSGGSLSDLYSHLPKDVQQAQSITFDSAIDTSNVWTTAHMFQYDGNVKSIDFQSFNTPKLQYMPQMFQYDVNLQSVDFGHFDTSQVLYMNQAFHYTTSLRTVIFSSDFDTHSTHSGLMGGFFSDAPKLTTLVIKSPQTKFYISGSNNPNLPRMYYKGSYTNPNVMKGYVPDNSKATNLADNQSHVGVWTTANNKAPYTASYFLSDKFHNKANQEIDAQIVSDLQNQNLTQSDLLTLQNAGVPTGYQLDRQNLVNSIFSDQGRINLNLVPIGLMINGTWGTTKWSLYKNGTLVLDGGSLESPVWPTEIPRDDVKRIKIINGVKAPQDTNQYDVDEKGLHSNSSYHNSNHPYFPDADQKYDHNSLHVANGNMPGLFGGLNQLQEIDVSGLDTSDTSDFSGMFNDNQQLKQIDGMSDNPHFNDYNKANGGQDVDLGYLCDQDYSLQHFEFSQYFNSPHVAYFEDVFNGGDSLLSVTGLNYINTTDAFTVANTFQDCKLLREVDIHTWDTRRAYALDKAGSNNQNALLFTDGTLSRIGLGPNTELAYDAIKSSTFYPHQNPQPSDSDIDTGYGRYNNPNNGPIRQIYDRSRLKTGWYYYTNLKPVHFHYTEWLTSDALPKDDDYTDNMTIKPNRAKGKSVKKLGYPVGLIRTYGQQLAFYNQPNLSIGPSDSDNFQIVLIPKHVIDYGNVNFTQYGTSGKYLLYSDGEMDIYGTQHNTKGFQNGDVSVPISQLTSKRDQVRSIVYKGGILNGNAVHNRSGWGPENNQSASDLYKNLPNLTRISFGGINQFNIKDASQVLTNLTNLQTINGIDRISFDNQANASNMLANDPQLQTITGSSDWNLSHVKDASGMFQNDAGLSDLNLSDVKASNLSDVNQMFAGDTGLNELNLNGLSFNEPGSVRMTGMFDKDNALSQLTLNQATHLNGQGQDWGAEFFTNNYTNIKNVKKSTTLRIKNGSQLTGTYYYGNAVQIHYVDEFSGSFLGTGRYIPNNNLINSLKHEKDVPAGYYIDPMSLQSDCKIYDSDANAYINVNVVNDHIWTGYRWGQANVVIDGIHDTIDVNNRYTGQTAPLVGSLKGEAGLSIDSDTKKVTSKGSPLDQNVAGAVLDQLPNGNSDWKVKVENGTAPADSSRLFYGQGSNLAGQIARIDLSGLDTSKITSTGERRTIYLGTGMPQETVNSGMFDDDSHLEEIIGLAKHLITVKRGSQKSTPQNIGGVSSIVNGAFNMFAHDHDLTRLNLSNLNTSDVKQYMSDMLVNDSDINNLILGSDTILDPNTKLPHAWIPNGTRSQHPIILNDGNIHKGDWAPAGSHNVMVTYQDVETGSDVGQSNVPFSPHAKSQVFSSQEIEHWLNFPSGYETYPISQDQFTIDLSNSNVPPTIPVAKQHLLTFGNWNVNDPKSARFEVFSDGADDPVKQQFAPEDGHDKLVFISNGPLDTSSWSKAGYQDSTGTHYAFDSDAEHNDGNSSNPNALNRNSIGTIEFKAPVKLDTSQGYGPNDHNMSGLFQSMHNLTSIIYDYVPDASQAENVSSMFANDDRLSLIDLSDWDLSNVKVASDMFAGDVNATHIIMPWSKPFSRQLTNLAGAFSSDHRLSDLQNLNRADVSSVSDLASTFESDRSLTKLDLSDWTDSQLSDMDAAFANDPQLQYLNIKGLSNPQMIIGGAISDFQNDFTDPQDHDYRIDLNRNLHLSSDSLLSGYWKATNDDYNHYHQTDGRDYPVNYLEDPELFLPRQLDQAGANLGPNLTTTWTKLSNDQNGLHNQTEQVRLYNQVGDYIGTRTVDVPKTYKGNYLIDLSDQLRSQSMPIGYRLPPKGRHLSDLLDGKLLKTISDSSIRYSDYDNHPKAYLLGDSDTQMLPVTIEYNDRPGSEQRKIRVTGYYGDTNNAVPASDWQPGPGLNYQFNPNKSSGVYNRHVYYNLLGHDDGYQPNGNAQWNIQPGKNSQQNKGNRQPAQPLLYYDNRANTLLRVIYVDQSGRQIGSSDNISGPDGEVVNVTDPDDNGIKVPNGYHLIGGMTNVNKVNSDDGVYGSDQDTVYTLNGKQRTVYLHVQGDSDKYATVQVHLVMTDANGHMTTTKKSVNLNSLNGHQVYDGDEIELNPSDSQIKPQGYSADYSKDSVQFIQIGNDGTPSPNDVTFYYRSTNTTGAPIALRYIASDGHGNDHEVGSIKVLQGDIGRTYGINISNLPMGYTIDSTKYGKTVNGVNGVSYPKSYTFTDSPQIIDVPVIGQQYDQKKYGPFKIYQYSDNNTGKTKIGQYNVYLNNNARVGDSFTVSPYGFGTNSVINQISDKNDSQQTSYSLPKSDHATPSDPDLTVRINSDGQLSQLSINYNYQSNNVDQTSLSTIRIHYITSDKGIKMNDGKSLPSSIGNHYHELDEESDSGTSNDTFDLTPYTDDIPESVSQYYDGVIDRTTSSDVVDGSNNIIKLKPSGSGYQWKFGAQPTDVYIKVHQNGDGNQPIIID